MVEPGLKLGQFRRGPGDRNRPVLDEPSRPPARTSLTTTATRAFVEWVLQDLNL
jgi:hypothetical protein